MKKYYNKSIMLVLFCLYILLCLLFFYVANSATKKKEWCSCIYKFETCGL